MKLSQLKESDQAEVRKKYIAWIEIYHQRNFDPHYLTMNSDGRCNYGLSLTLCQLDRIAIPFGKISGDFTILASNKKIKSLQNSPTAVLEDFTVVGQNLTSLKDGPKSVYGSYIVANNHLADLDGISEKIGSGLNLVNNRLIDLKDIHKKIKQVNGVIDIADNPIESNVLGLLMIDGVKRIIGDQSQLKFIKILNKHLGKGKAGVLAAQNELIDADLDDYAEL